MEKIRKFQESVEPVITAALREAILAQSDTPLALVHAHLGRVLDGSASSTTSDDAAAAFTSSAWTACEHANSKLMAPPRPTAAELAAGATATGAVLALRAGLSVQRGPFKSCWVRVSGSVPAAALRAVVSRALELQRDVGKGKGGTPTGKAAVFVAIAVSCLQRGAAVDVEWLAAQGFAFHHAVPDNTELVYVCDQAGMTPAYATSIEGATGVVFSPDEEKILSVWERGGWNTPGGAVDPGEMKIEALAREIREEVRRPAAAARTRRARRSQTLRSPPAPAATPQVGITNLDPAFAPVYLGGWQKGKARDDSVNDNFSAFAVRAITEDFAIDHKEIGVAMWLPWRELLAAWRDAGRPADGKITPLDGCKGLPDGKPGVSVFMLQLLDNYEAGRGMGCTVKEAKGEVRIGLPK